ncbi:argininosuccinate synthase, partial [Candidatus Micrarchaeota archaeon]|nr:argininosuccinate synthase [Candidatus Micrarchaeota archaeon]
MHSKNYEAEPGEIEKAVLLYSGGLDTSVLLKMIHEKYGAGIITLTVDLGQPDDFSAVKEKALSLGAEKAVVVDAKQEFCNEYISKAIKANALYEGKYPLHTALGRPLIAKLAVEIAQKYGAQAIAHGCTGKGNDQVRIDGSVLALNPEMKIIAPVRKYALSRSEEIAYAQKHGIPIPVSIEKPYSVDENLWGRAIAGGVLEDADVEPQEDVFMWANGKNNGKTEYAEIEFSAGIPIALNSKQMPLHELIAELNIMAGACGVGIIDTIEDKIIGMKTREVYECPAAVCIIEAHKELEKMVCTIHENNFKPSVDRQWAFNVYAGLWFDPLMQDLDAFIESVNSKVSGTVKLKLSGGACTIAGRKSANSLYNAKLNSYENSGM